MGRTAGKTAATRIQIEGSRLRKHESSGPKWEITPQAVIFLR